MDRERGDEIPYAPWARQSPGRAGRFTAEEIERIREMHRRWNQVRIERIRLCKTLNLRSDMFNRIGVGRIGKKPRRA